MNYGAGGNDDHKEDELRRVPEYMLASAYLDKRQQQILQTQEEISSLQRSIRNVMMDISHLLVASPSTGNQAMLERSYGELKGLANSVAQAGADAPAGSGASRGADVDLNGTRAAIETHANAPSGNAAKEGDDKRGAKAARAKELPAIDAAPTAEADQNGSATSGTTTPGDAKPVGDTPASNLDRVNKLALAEGRTQDDPASAATSDPSSLRDRRGSRSKMATLKLDHAEAVAKSDAPGGQVAAQGAELTAQVASTHAKAEPAVVASVRKPPSPGGV